MDGLGPQFLIASSFNLWYLVLQRSMDVLNVFLESELRVKSNSQKFHLMIDF